MELRSTGMRGLNQNTKEVNGLIYLAPTLRVLRGRNNRLVAGSANLNSFFIRLKVLLLIWAEGVVRQKKFSLLGQWKQNSVPY